MTVFEFKEGIYFGMPEEQYHAIPALSASGIKKMCISTMDFWANSWLNPDKPEEEEKIHLLDGKAYHARILEGKRVFDDRYKPAFNESDYPDALKTTDEIKEVLREMKENGADVTLAGKKQDLIDRMLDVNPNIEVIDVLKADHEAKYDGYELIQADTFKQIELAAAMIENHDELCMCFRNGYPEVTVLWICKETGVRMKARFDFLKLRSLVDLKTFANRFGKPIDRAITSEIANYKMHIQVAVYLEANGYAKGFVKEGKVFGKHDADWLAKYAETAADETQFIFVFQQKGIAPVARGRIFPRGLVLDCGYSVIRDMKELFVKCEERYGALPWVDISSIDQMDDSDFPAYIAEA